MKGRRGTRPARRRFGLVRSSGDGCASWIATCAATLLLLWVNVAVVRSVYQTLSTVGGPWLAQPKVEQAFVLTLPAILLFVQWWIWEIAAEWIWPDAVGEE